MSNLCEEYNLTREEIKRSQTKYINNRNSHMLLGKDEVLRCRVPRNLTPAKAKVIEKEMERFAYE